MGSLSVGFHSQMTSNAELWCFVVNPNKLLNNSQVANDLRRLDMHKTSLQWSFFWKKSRDIREKEIDIMPVGALIPGFAKPSAGIVWTTDIVYVINFLQGKFYITMTSHAHNGVQNDQQLDCLPNIVFRLCSSVLVVGKIREVTAWWRHKNGNTIRVTGPLCWEFTSHRWIPLTKASGAELWCFLDLRLDKRLSKQSRRRLFESSRSLWRHCKGAGEIGLVIPILVIWICMNSAIYIAHIHCHTDTTTTNVRSPGLMLVLN